MARDTDTFSSAQGLTPGPDSASMFDDDARPIVMMDPPDHTDPAPGVQADRIVSLGYGAHHCLRSAEARLQAAIALERLLDRFPHFEVDAAAGRFAPGSFVRRYESLPFSTGA